MKQTKLIKSLKRYCTDSGYRFLIHAGLGKYNGMDSETYLKKKYAALLGYECDLVKPVTFNEKLQWIKLYDRDSRYTVMADKVLVKDYVAQQIGEQYIIPTLGVWDTAEDVDFDALPNKFVLKCNHNSGLGMCICKDKSKLDIPKVRKSLTKGLRQDYYLTGREWPYKDIPRKVIAEQFLENDENGLTDYKFHCFNGQPKFVLVCQDRFSASGLTEDFYDINWQRLPVKRPKIPLAAQPIPRPQKLDEMLALAEKLSKDIPFLRVDFYCVEGKIYFSELTFFPASGFAPFEPEQWDKTFGDWLELPAKTEERS